jgi:NADPH:quinone reductase-like Zn-dependent oxidoreductase
MKAPSPTDNGLERREEKPSVTDLAKKRIVVTGGAGFLGQAVLRVLRQRGVGDDQIVVPRRRACSTRCNPIAMFA